eukprot:SAG22_NODE_1287_length_4872_cov_2.731615_2_plen_56_part_00
MSAYKLAEHLLVLQSLAYQQLTGSDLKDSLTVAEKEAALREAMEADRILLVLDDL